MTEKEQLKEMFTRRKIEFEETTPTEILVERGYPQFYVKFTFTADGDLANVEAYE